MTPRVSIVVPVRRAQHTVGATIAALLGQCREVDGEIIVAVSESDSTAEIVRAVVRTMPDSKLRVVVQPGRSSVPQLRRDGCRAAQAPFVVITEDHCLFAAGWLRTLLEESERRAVVTGGPVANGRLSWAGWAQYFTRYSAFTPPVAGGPTRGLPGNNACYPRAVLDAHADLLRDGFWEAEFNETAGPLWMLPDAVVTQHQQRGALEFIALRYRHGRCYGARRPDKSIFQTPLVPALLLARAARAVFHKRRYRARFLITLPLLLVYFCAWAAGEAVGYAFGAGGSCLETD